MNEEKKSPFHINTKVLYLFIYLCLLFKGWSLKAFPSFSGDVLLVIEYVYLLFGFFHWRKQPTNFLSKENTFFFKWIMLGIFLSMIPASLYHNQSISISLTTYRAQYLWFSLPVLFRIAPTEKEIIKVCTIVLVIMCGVYLCKRFIPNLIVIEENAYVNQYKKSYDVGYVPGMTMAIFSLYYYYQKIYERFNKENILFFVLAFVFLLAMSNRSNLFASVIILGIATFSIKSKYRPIYVILASIVAVFLIYNTLPYWRDLLLETNTQIGDADYNRNKAFDYFVYQASDNVLSIFLGNGFLSSRSSSTMADLMEMGIFNSDMGFIGFWNQFGLIPIIAFIAVPILALKDKFTPLYIKLLGVHILLCSFTTSYYGTPGHAIIYILIYYLWIYNKNKNQQVRSFNYDINNNRRI